MSSDCRNVVAGCTIAAFFLAACAEGAEQEFSSDRLAAGAMLAQTRCYRLIHHDTWQFGDCVRTLAATERRPDDLRLGIEYFGWVGAMNSARLGMLGADETAQEFLARFRKTQKKLKVDDRTLCAAIPGDCVARIARLKQMEAELRTNPAVK